MCYNHDLCTLDCNHDVIVLHSLPPSHRQVHSNYIGRDSKVGPVLFSLMFDEDYQGTIIRALLRCAHTHVHTHSAHTHTHSTHTHTHTHTIHAYTHGYTHTHTCTCTRAHTYTTHICTHAHTYTTHTCTHAHTYTTHTCTAHTCTHMDMCTTSYPTLGLIYHLPTLSHFPLTHTPSLLTPHSSPLTPHLSPPPPFLSERRRRRCIRFSLHHKFQNKWSRKTISGWVVQSSEWLHHNYITDSTTCIGHAFHIRLIYYTFRWPIPVAMAIAYTTFWESLYPSDRANS